MPPIKIGINLWSQASSWADFLAAAKRVDELGYDSLWTWDHLHAIVGDPQQPIFEGYTTLGAWAATRTRPGHSAMRRRCAASSRPNGPVRATMRRCRSPAPLRAACSS
jgi:hypothetical protein